MKKPFVLVLSILCAAALAAPAFAAKKGTPEYERLAALKKERREQREREKANPAERKKGFWQKEAERSGLAGTAAMFGNAVDRVVPGEGKRTK